jgi:predicted transcriptional regulator
LKLSRIKELLECEELSSSHSGDVEIENVMPSDMMSDVLAFAQPEALLITGLVNSQSVRTADFADAILIIYIRGRKPDEQTIELAKDLNISVMATDLGMFEACGILYEGGLKGIC